MQATTLVLDALGRTHELIPGVLKDLTLDDVLWQPDPAANSIGWLIWHLTRVEDDHLAGIAGREQVWLSGWSQRFGLPYAPSAHGYGMTPAEVQAFTLPSVEALVDYAGAVATQSDQILATLTETDYDTVIDTRWDPPVTIGVRLVSVIVELAQHIGQAAYLRGLRERAIERPSNWAGHL